jgi:hypothetical protein
MRPYVLASLLLLSGNPADAGPDRLSVLLGSHHLSPAEEFEEFNPGLFLTWEGPVFDTTAGLFRNSYGRGAVALTAAYPFYESGRFQFSGFLGAAYYPENGRNFRYHLGDVVPLGGLQARFGPVFVQAIPGDGEEADGLFAFGFTVPLGPR